MGRRHRGKDSKKASVDVTVSDRLKDARHEFQTISQTFPIARQLLLDEIKRLESESGDAMRSCSSLQTSSQKEKIANDDSQTAALSSESETHIKCVNKGEPNGHSNSPATVATDNCNNTTDKDQTNESLSILPKARNETMNIPDRWDQLSPKDDFSACDELKTIPLNCLQDLPEFSPRSLENEKSSMKIFIPHHEYPGVSCCVYFPDAISVADMPYRRSTTSSAVCLDLAG
jgi:hypothetical protein